MRIAVIADEYYRRLVAIWLPAHTITDGSDGADLWLIDAVDMPPALPDNSIVMVLGPRTEETAQTRAAFQAGAQDVISKPYSRDALLHNLSVIGVNLEP